MIHVDLAPQIRWAKDGSVVATPREVYVSSFSQSAVRKFREDVAEAAGSGQPVIPLHVQSYGGSAHGLLAMVDILDSIRGQIGIATIATGNAMSAACALLSCGDEGLRFCAPNVTLMVHEVSSFSAGKTIDIQSDARETARLNQSVLSVMDRGCGHPPGYFSQLIHSKGHADVFLSAKQALKHNLCNVIGLPHLALQVTAEYAFGVPAVPKPHKHSAACKHGGPKSGKAAK